MYTVNKQDAKQKEFILVRNRQTLEINKVLAPHELQIGVEGYKDSSLRVLGDEYIAGSLEIRGGARGTLKLPDGGLAILSDTGIKVTETPNDTVTLSLGTPTGGIETLILAGSGLQSSVNNGVLTLELTESLQFPTLVAGTGISLTQGPGTITISTTGNAAQLSGATFTGPVQFLSGLSGSLTTLTDGITPYLTAGQGVTITTGSNGQVQISAVSGAGSLTELVMNGQLSGVQDGVNTVFTIQHAPSDVNSFMLWLNGQLLTRNADYTLNSTTVTFSGQIVPVTNDVIRVMYPRATVRTAYALCQSPASMIVTMGVLSGVTTVHDPDPPSSLMLFLNGQLLTQGSGQDYMLSGNSVTFLKPFEATDTIQLTYSYVA
jgi:hypothetical protein